MTTFRFLHQFFEDAARRWPDRTALDVPPAPGRPERCRLTYAELNGRADALAQRLLEWVTEEECAVVLVLPRGSEHLYAAQLGVLKAGAAFACIDPAFPDSQVRTILDDATPVAILTDGAGAERMRRLASEAIVVDVAAAAAARPGGASVPAVARRRLLPTSLAYLIYTSGTTGRPKGVMIEHRSIANLVQGDLDTLGVVPDDRVAQQSSPAYDSSIEETWFALAAGATLVPMDDDTARLGPDLVPWLRDERITMFCPSPTVLRGTGCTDPEDALPCLRLIHPGGEALSQDVADRWASGRRMVNDYGPTEATITALRQVIEPGRPVSIGRPVPGMRAWVLDADLNEVPDGQRGELCLGGVGLARGYRHEPGLTAEKFPVHPRLGRVYRTGDLASRQAGEFSCHGRIDGQVKLRGYRIELEAIEARLAEQPGLREAACAVQGNGARSRLVAFVVPEPNSAPPASDALRGALRAVLPAYMVPTLWGILERLPRNMSGKLDRQALPRIEAGGAASRARLEPRTAVESRLVHVFQEALGLGAPPSIDEDFFDDLGGDSLSAAVAISLLRDDPETGSLAVRDLYEARTAADLVERAHPAASSEEAVSSAGPGEAAPAGSTGEGAAPARPFVATLVQSLVLLLGTLLSAPVAYVGLMLLARLVRAVGVPAFLLLTPGLYVGGLLVYTVSSVSAAVLLKQLLIGEYRPMRAPVWGSFHVRNWIVQRFVALIPRRLLQGTVFQNLVLRALGARIGRRVHLHAGVDLAQGGWDLLEIGDDVAVGQDVRLGLVTLEDGQLVLGPVTLEHDATLEVRAGVGSHTRVGAGAVLTAWSYLAPGGSVPPEQRWDGVPAGPAGRAPADPARDDPRSADLSPGVAGSLLVLGRLGLTLFRTLPLQGVALAFFWTRGLDGAGAAEWLFDPRSDAWIALLDVLLLLAAVPAMLVFQLLSMRLMGRVRPGVIGRFSLPYVRARLKAETTESAGRWLCGTLLWPVWLRAAGMRIGRGCEVSTIMDTIPELVEIGPEAFLADGIHLAGPRISRGLVNLAPVQLGAGVFLGNHSVIAGGQRIPSGVLVGVCTVADAARMCPGSAWFGHPSFELHQREPAGWDRRLTHEPSSIRYVNRVLWELLRFAVPLPSVLLALAWLQALGWAAGVVSRPVLLLAVIPALELGAAALLVAFVLALKWLLLARAGSGAHPLWCCWCSRWDFLYVAWDVLARPILLALDGCLLLNAYMRWMGARIGRRVVLGPGFAHVADPDMLDFGDGATVSSLIQSHTFEDRVLKLDRVRVEPGATVGAAALLLYGSTIGAGARVMPHSVVLKRERLVPGGSFGGFPVRPFPRGRAGQPSVASQPSREAACPAVFAGDRSAAEDFPPAAVLDQP